MTKIHKSARLNDETIVKLEQLIELETKKNIEAGVGSATTTTIISNAINYYHSMKIGKEMMFDSMSNMQDSIVHLVSDGVKKYSDQFVQATEYIQFQNLIIERLLIILLKSADVLPEDLNDLEKTVLSNRKYETHFRNLIRNEILNNSVTNKEIK